LDNRTKIMIGAGAVLALALVGYIASRRISAAIPANAFNPLSADNFAYQGVNAIGAAVTGDKDWSLGVAIFEATHAEPDLTAPTGAPAELPPSHFWINAP
jgi:hypothetical protein